MFNSIIASSNAGQSKRVAYNPDKGYKLHIKQSVSVSYRRATNGHKPKYSVRQLQYAMGMVAN